MDKIKHLKNPIYLGLIEAFLLNAESKEVVEIYIRTELDLSGGSCFCGGSHGKADETYLSALKEGILLIEESKDLAQFRQKIKKIRTMINED